MNQEKERYLQNRTRVFEIYGISEKDKRYNCHHIVQKSDVGVLVGLDFDVDGKSNLCPVLKEDHNYINERISFNDGLFKLKQKWDRPFKRRICR